MVMKDSGIGMEVRKSSLGEMTELRVMSQKQGERQHSKEEESVCKTPVAGVHLAGVGQDQKTVGLGQGEWTRSQRKMFKIQLES